MKKIEDKNYEANKNKSYYYAQILLMAKSF